MLFRRDEISRTSAWSFEDLIENIQYYILGKSPAEISEPRLGPLVARKIDIVINFVGILPSIFNLIKSPQTNGKLLRPRRTSMEHREACTSEAGGCQSTGMWHEDCLAESHTR